MNENVDLDITARRTSDGQAARSMRSTMRDYLRGVACIFDVTGSLSRHRISTMRHDTDTEVLAEDWDAVGADLHRAMGQQVLERSTG